MQELKCKYKYYCNNKKIMIVFPALNCLNGGFKRCQGGILINFLILHFLKPSKKNCLMLQRIQTVYLFLVGLLAIALIFVPLGSFDLEGIRFPLGVLGLESVEGIPSELRGNWLGYLLPALVLMILILTFFTIFQYKRRRYQIQLGKFNILLHIGLVVAAFFFIDQFSAGLPGISFRYGVGIFLPLVSMILVLLANRAIKKDDELVRAADRIR